MACVGCKDLAKEILLHEILGTEDGGGTTPDFQISGGHVYFKDPSRSDKWLSIDRFNIFSARKGRVKNTYLPYIDGQRFSTTGVKIPRNGTLLSIIAETRNSETWTLHVRKNGSETNIASLPIVAATGSQTTIVDVDLDAGDKIQLYAETTSMLGVRDLNVWVEIAWRL